MAQVQGPAQPPQVSGPQPSQQAGQPQQYNPPPQPDAKIQALIEADFKRVNLKLGPPNNAQALCASHGLEKCSDCGVDFTGTNALARVFVQNPNLVVPPPPQVVQPQRSQAVNKTKEDGNVLYRAGKLKEAVAMYTMAVNVAAGRLPWEPNQLMRDELSTVLSNRSAAFNSLGDHVSALVDAELVIQLKRTWSKGHFRKAKALVDLDRLEEARDAVKIGLAHDPNNTELKNFLEELDARIAKKK